MTKYDPRYTYQTCPKCYRRIQRIDWRGSLHELTCGHPVPDPVEPLPHRPLREDAWQEWDKRHNLENPAFRT